MQTIQMQTQTRYGTRLRPWLTVTGLRRSVMYQPLAVLMAILLLPALSWMDTGAAAPRPFQARAQVINPCAPGGNSIFQTDCVNGVIYYNDLTQLESDAVTAYLSMHSLPASDAHLIYDKGREDLRNAIRGVMMDILKAIIQKPASQRTAHEQTLYTWLQTLVQQNEIAEYTAALNNFNSFLSDPCTFTLDPDLAAQYKLSFDGTPFCFAGWQSSIFSPMMPASSYFVAYGMKQSYEKPAGNYPYFPGLVAGTGIGEYKAAADLAILGAAISIAYIIPVIQTLVQWAYLAYAIALTTAETLQALDTLTALAPVVGIIGTGATYLGPLGIILDCIISGAVAAFEIYNNQQVQNDINNMKVTLSQVQTTPPDLSTFLTDSVGLNKLRMSLVAQTLPDVPSSATLPAHGSSDLNFSIAPSAGGSPTVGSTLSYQDWRGDVWQAQTYGGWFVQTCFAPGANPCPQTDSLSVSIQYVDWSGVNWIASRNGSTFVSSKANPASTDVACPADSTGVSPGSSFSNCASYASHSIPLTTDAGAHVSVSLVNWATPAFTSSTSLSFGPSIPSTQTITASGNPAPSICVSSSNLPANFSAKTGDCQNGGSFQLVFDGSPSAPNGLYSLGLTAHNPVGTTVQTFAINVSPQLGIISPNSMYATAGVPANFTVVTTGNPAPKLSTDIALGGLSFQDNGNGTATIGGIYSSNVIISNCTSVPTEVCGNITATSSQGTVSQQFTINVAFPPTAVIPGCSPYSGDPNLNQCPGTTFYVNAPNQVLLTTTGETTPVTSWSLSGWIPAQPPSWVNLHDNGNGTAVLSGTPPAGTTGTFSVLVNPTAAYAGFGHPNIYPITVVNTPVFISPSTASFTAGTAGSFPVSTNMGTIGLASALPKGLSFAATGNVGTISGTPAAGTGGQYILTLNDNAGTAGSTTQLLTLNVNEAPQITSSSTATMFVGTPGMFAVTTTGFPNVSNHAIPANTPPPTSPSQGQGMYFTVTGLPSDLRATNLDGAGFAGGTLTIQGTPSAADAGSYQVNITAQNAVGQPATQTLTLNIINVTGPAPASGSACNGNYTGTFQGTITVSAGQNCAFFGGGISGSVSVNGGSLALTNATVTGNLSIQGPSAFSIGPGTSINGNLSIQNVGSASTTSQICQANLAGNLDISNNAIPILIGSPQAFCFGNSFGNNVDLQGNTAAISFYDNSVGKNLSCSNNSSITGGADTAQKKQGQCSLF